MSNIYWIFRCRYPSLSLCLCFSFRISGIGIVCSGYSSLFQSHRHCLYCIYRPQEVYWTLPSSLPVVLSRGSWPLVCDHSQWLVGMRAQHLLFLGVIPLLSHLLRDTYRTGTWALPRLSDGYTRMSGLNGNGRLSWLMVLPAEIAGLMVSSRLQRRSGSVEEAFSRELLPQSQMRVL